MKVTIGLPDNLYRRVKAKSALSGLSVREVTAKLYRQWIADSTPSELRPHDDWLTQWLAFTIPAQPTGADRVRNHRQHVLPSRSPSTPWMLK